MRIDVYTTPRADKDEVVGWRGAELHVRVRAVPESGQANAAVCVVLASALGVPKSSVSVVRGHSSRHKSLEVDDVTEPDLVAAVGSPDPPLF